MGWGVPESHVLAQFHKWEKKAKKENSDTLANILEEQERKEEK